MKQEKICIKHDKLKYIFSAALTLIVTVSLMLQDVLIVKAEPKTGVPGSQVAYDQSNPSYHYFYNQLSREAQRFYQAMEEMLREGYFANVEEYDLTANGKVTDGLLKSWINGDTRLEDECGAAIYAFHEDYPDAFYVDFTSFSMKAVLEGDGKWHGYLGAGLLRTFTKQNIPQAVERYEKAIEDALKDLPTKASGNQTLAEAQTCYIHDYLVKNMVYHYESEVSNANCNARTAYDALVYGEGVCEAYTRGFKALMDRAGIPTVCVSGTYSSSSGRNEEHIWNYVQINGRWYGVDATHDDPTVKGSDKKNSKRETRKFCLVGAQDFARNRIPDGILSEINYEFRYPSLEQKNLRKKSILSRLNEALAMPASLIIAGYVVFAYVKKAKVSRRTEIEQR